MANTYSWLISGVETNPAVGDLTDVVRLVHWRRQVTDGTNTTDIYGAENIELNLSEKFTSFSDLTPAIIEGWLEEALGADKISALNSTLDQKLADVVNPPVVNKPLPWELVI